MVTLRDLGSSTSAVVVAAGSEHLSRGAACSWGAYGVVHNDCGLYKVQHLCILGQQHCG